RFPFLIFRKDPSVYVIASAVTLAAAILGALKAVAGVVRLPPAVAMAPPAPDRYQRLSGIPLDRWLGLSRIGVMAFRHLAHKPGRTASATFGIALAVAVLVASLWTFPSVDYMVEATFYHAERQDASISFGDERRYAALFEAMHLPGVLAVEPYRNVPVRIRHGHVERRVAISGKLEDSDLSRVLDSDLRPVPIPAHGLAVSDMLARLLDVRVGDIVELDLLDGARRTVEVPVAAIVEGYLGLTAYMEIEALNRIMREGAMISGVHIAYDTAHEDAFFAAVKENPATNFIALQRISVQRFKDTVAENILIMVTVYVAFAAIIAIGVVYNAARISLSERGRELASLRVLGFTRGEVSRVLLTELAVISLAAQPLGWLIGFGFAFAMAKGFESELYRIPFVITSDVYAASSLVVIISAIISAFAVRRRIDRLDLIEVLKTRE
ncbi:MAG: FtsX-like permease family protein, partial [Hyphomicrobiales bacterium]|nr:FtsX-like permease family protein [Hyphomicrobiales bacterium]